MGLLVLSLINGCLLVSMTWFHASKLESKNPEKTTTSSITSIEAVTVIAAFLFGLVQLMLPLLIFVASVITGLQVLQ